MRSKAKAKKIKNNEEEEEEEEWFPVVVDKRQEGLVLMKSCLAFPYLYLDSPVKEKVKLWVYSDNNGMMVYRSISYVPALYRMFNEILLNAFDNKQRDPSMDSLEVKIDPRKNKISVYNNGDGVPVCIHPEAKVYVPEMVFSYLFTGDNCGVNRNSNVNKTTTVVGKSGMGAKLTNLFSTKFVVNTADGRHLKKYKQVFTNNIQDKSDPEITECKANEKWTKVTFHPDLKRFNMDHLEKDIFVLMKTRVMQMAACLGNSVTVKFNGLLLPINSFRDYVNLYLKSAEKSRKLTLPMPRAHAKVSDWCEICVSLSDGKFQQVSFANSVATTQGGTHVDYITDQITTYLMNKVNEKNKDADVKADDAKNHLWVFVNALVYNPKFGTAGTMERLSTSPASFGSKWDVPESMLMDVADFGIVEKLLDLADIKQRIANSFDEKES